MKIRYLQYWKPIVLVTIFISVSFTFYFLTPETILAYIGFENAYIILLLLAFLGGVTTFSGVPYHIILIAFASGGMNPLLLGIMATSGVVLGDTTSFYLGTQSKKLLSVRMRTLLEKLNFIEKKSPRLMTLIFFSYGALVPFSNDILIIPSGLLGYRFWRVMIPIALGTLVFNTGLAFIATYFSEYLSLFM